MFRPSSRAARGFGGAQRSAVSNINIRAWRNFAGGVRSGPRAPGCYKMCRTTIVRRYIVRSNQKGESIVHFATACACDGQRTTGEILDYPFSF